MKLKEWANMKGISYITAYRWFKANKIPNAVQLDTGTILVEDEKEIHEKLDEILRILKNDQNN